MSRFRLGVLVSGSGTNLQSIIERLHEGSGDIEVAVVVSDKPGAYGLKRAEKAGIPTAVLRPQDYAERVEHDWAVADALEHHGADLVVLAGYMRVMTPAFLDRFPYKVVNLHPSLLPSFP
ncbi:MAG: phosphoribosylglycinamide formyltransferase, partial [Thermoleophilia bacterium]